MRSGHPIDHPTTAKALETISRLLRRKQAQIDSLVNRRNELVLEAITEGWSDTQISRICGLSRARIGQLAQRMEMK